MTTRGAEHEVTSTANAVPISVEQFKADVERMSHDLITKEMLSNYLAHYTLSQEAIDQYQHWSDEKHTRNKIFRNDAIEAMLICWNIGNRTPLHTHNGQLGWMTMLQGRLLVENFRLRECNKPENQEVVGMDCLAGASYIDMEALDTELVAPGGALNTVDKHHTIHRISNLPEWNQRAISLHIYARPIDSCVVFDLEASRCFRRDLKYDYE